MAVYLRKTNDALLQLLYKSECDHCFCEECRCGKSATKDRDCLKYPRNEKDILTYYEYKYEE